jgi:hypothetical protein
MFGRQTLVSSTLALAERLSGVQTLSSSRCIDELIAEPACQPVCRCWWKHHKLSAPAMHQAHHKHLADCALARGHTRACPSILAISLRATLLIVPHPDSTKHVCCVIVLLCHRNPLHACSRTTPYASCGLFCARTLSSSCSSTSAASSRAARDSLQLRDPRLVPLALPAHDCNSLRAGTHTSTRSCVCTTSRRAAPASSRSSRYITTTLLFNDSFACAGTRTSTRSCVCTAS